MSNYEDIRPYFDEEVTAVISRLTSDTDLLDFLGKYHSPKLSQYLPGMVRFGVKRMLKQKLGSVTSILEFQTMVAAYAEKLVAETMTSFTHKGIEGLDKDAAYLYVGNHRDIAGDSMLVDYALWLSGRDTVRIAVGDNLVQRQFATDLMRLNKSFFIKRSEEGAKKVYAALLNSSSYIHDSIKEGQSIWIAQSEGRAKDGFDITDPAIIKMFALAKRKSPLAETVRDLNIVPVSISYEYDPCDYLKAKELSIIATAGCYEKPEGEDLLSLVKGLGEFKGRVTLVVGKPLDDEVQSAEEVANAIDHQVLENYQLYYINYWALARLAETNNSENHQQTWTALSGTVDLERVDTTDFEARFNACPAAHRDQWLAMYANPVVNKYHAKSSHLTPI